MAKEKNYLLESERNIFLTGKAGTGKTYNIKQYVEKMESEGKKVLVCAPTGTAAVNAGGETCHSLLGIPIPCYGVSISKTPASKIKILAGADAIIIDEVSMMRNDAFSYAIRVIRKAEKLKGSRIRIILTGDFSQLPPVVPKKEEKMLKKFGYDLSGYAFTTKEWGSLNLKVVELTKIYRQEEVEFIENLAKVRDCDASSLDYFNQFVDESYGMEIVEEERVFSFDDLEDDEEFNPFQDEDEEFEEQQLECNEEDEEKPINPKLLDADCIVLCGTNAEAERINRAYLDSMESMLMAYQSSKKGRNNSSDIDDIILMKEGCKVMFTVNDVIRNRYQNGTMGKVTMCHKDHVSVRLEDGTLVSVYPHEYTSYSYKITGGELTKSKVGSIKQIPLKIAAAVTIHKSQGKTFDKAIISPSVFASGQLYVALSRVRTPEGIILTEPITEKALVENKIVSDFYNNSFSYELPKKTTRSKTVLSTEELDEKSSKEAKKTTSKKTTSSRKTTKAKPTSTKKATTTKKVAKSTPKKSSTKTASASKKVATKGKKTSTKQTSKATKTTSKPKSTSKKSTTNVKKVTSKTTRKTTKKSTK